MCLLRRRPSTAASTRCRRSRCSPGGSGAVSGRWARAPSGSRSSPGCSSRATSSSGTTPSPPWVRASRRSSGTSRSSSSRSSPGRSCGSGPGARTLASVPVVLAGVVLISGVVGADAYGSNPGLGVLFGVLTAITYAGFLLVLRAGSTDLRRPAGPLYWATLSSALVTLPVGAALGELELEPTWPEHGWLLVLALTSQVIGWLLIAAALPRLPAALTSITLDAAARALGHLRGHPPGRVAVGGPVRGRGGDHRRRRARDGGPPFAAVH